MICQRVSGHFRLGSFLSDWQNGDTRVGLSNPAGSFSLRRTQCSSFQAALSELRSSTPTSAIISRAGFRLMEANDHQEEHLRRAARQRDWTGRALFSSAPAGLPGASQRLVWRENWQANSGRRQNSRPRVARCSRGGRPAPSEVCILVCWALRVDLSVYVNCCRQLRAWSERNSRIGTSFSNGWRQADKSCRRRRPVARLARL